MCPQLQDTPLFRRGVYINFILGKCGLPALDLTVYGLKFLVFFLNDRIDFFTTRRSEQSFLERLVLENF